MFMEYVAEVLAGFLAKALVEVFAAAEVILLPAWPGLVKALPGLVVAWPGLVML